MPDSIATNNSPESRDDWTSGKHIFIQDLLYSVSYMQPHRAGAALRRNGNGFDQTHKGFSQAG
jgi:hypothetical protein